MLENIEKLKKIISEAGVVGAGGAGFPSHLKLNEKIKTILINGTECEPLLKTDFYLLSAFRDEIEQTLNRLCDMLDTDGVIGIKKHTAEALNIENNHKIGKVTYRAVGDVYPAGDEIILIKEALGRAVPAGNFPSSVSVVVYNVETLLNIGNALNGQAVTKKYLTVGGATDKTYVLKADVGTSVADIFKKLKIKLNENITVLDGGPMMGNIINPALASVTKTTKGLLLIDKNTLCIKQKTQNLSDAINRAAGGCCGCRMCTDLCPRHLMGYPIYPHKILSAVTNRITDTKTYMGAFYCSNCGLCQTIACQQNISPNKLFKRVKNELIKNGIKPIIYENSTPLKAAEYRKILVSRIVNRLGVKKYDRDEFEVVDLM